MKKMMMLAAMAMMAVTAQAVTMTWETGAADSIYSGKKFPTDATSSTATQASFSILVQTKVAAIANDTVQGGHNIATIGVTTGAEGVTAQNLYALMYGTANNLGDPDGHIGVEEKVTTDGTWGVEGSLPDTKADGQYLLTFTIERNDNSVNVVGYANEVGATALYKVFETSATLTSNFELTVTTSQEDSNWTILETAAYDGILSTENIAWMTKEGTAVLPEPTALALLALGVAGVALKRKMK